MKHRWIAGLLWCLAGPLAAQSITERPGHALPLDLPFTDAAGHPLLLRELFGDRPVLLVPGYYRCPQLCGLLMHGLLDALAAAPMPAWRVVRFSLDASEGPQAARERLAVDRAYAAHVGLVAPEIEALSGPAAAALAQALGVDSRRTDDATQPIAHTAGVIIATPGGRQAFIERGVLFDAATLRRHLAQAALGHVAAAPSPSPLSLLCAHVDLTLGRHSGAVMHAVQALFGTAVVVLLGVWGLWGVRGLNGRRARRRGRR